MNHLTTSQHVLIGASWVSCPHNIISEVDHHNHSDKSGGHAGLSQWILPISMKSTWPRSACENQFLINTNLLTLGWLFRKLKFYLVSSPVFDGHLAVLKIWSLDNSDPEK